MASSEEDTDYESLPIPKSKTEFKFDAEKSFASAVLNDEKLPFKHCGRKGKQKSREIRVDSC